METLWQDVRYSLRVLGKNHGFAAIAILTLALGIGANTALFSVVNGVLLRPLPYPQSDRIVAISEKTANFDRSSISYPNFLDWRRSNSTFSSIAAYRSDDFSMTGSGEPERVRIGMVSAGFFEILGVTPTRGRLFTAEEDRLGTTPAAILSAGLWQRKFGSAPDIVGKRITMNAWLTRWLAFCPRISIFKARIMNEPRMSLSPPDNSRIPAFRIATCTKGRAPSAV